MKNFIREVLFDKEEEPDKFQVRTSCIQNCSTVKIALI